MTTPATVVPPSGEGKHHGPEAVLDFLAERSSPDGYVKAYHSDIASGTGIAVRTVKRHLAALKADGRLTWERARIPGTPRYGPNAYVIQGANTRGQGAKGPIQGATRGHDITPRQSKGPTESGLEVIGKEKEIEKDQLPLGQAARIVKAYAEDRALSTSARAACLAAVTQVIEEDPGLSEEEILGGLKNPARVASTAKSILWAIKDLKFKAAKAQPEETLSDWDWWQKVGIPRHHEFLERVDYENRKQAALEARELAEGQQ
jgi:hypothetical protein